MRRIFSGKSLVRDVIAGNPRVHLLVRDEALGNITVGERVHLYYNHQIYVAAYVTAIRSYTALTSLLNMEQWKHLTPQMRNQRQSHRALHRQFGKDQEAGYVVLEYTTGNPDKRAAT